MWPASQSTSADWPRLKAALRLIWRRRGVREGEVAVGRLASTQLTVAAARMARRLEDGDVTRNVDARGSTVGRGCTEPCTRPRHTSAAAVGLRMRMRVVVMRREVNPAEVLPMNGTRGTSLVAGLAETWIELSGDRVGRLIPVAASSFAVHRARRRVRGRQGSTDAGLRGQLDLHLPVPSKLHGKLRVLSKRLVLHRLGRLLVRRRDRSGRLRRTHWGRHAGRKHRRAPTRVPVELPLLYVHLAVAVHRRRVPQIQARAGAEER